MSPNRLTQATTHVTPVTGDTGDTVDVNRKGRAVGVDQGESGGQKQQADAKCRARSRTHSDRRF